MNFAAISGLVIRRILPVSAVLLAQTQFALAQGNVMEGRNVAHKCEVCHGIDGVAVVVEAPNLAGQKSDYIIAQLNAFKTGQRQNPMMSVVAPTLSDKEIEDVAAYYSAITVTVSKVPGQ